MAKLHRILIGAIATAWTLTASTAEQQTLPSWGVVASQVARREPFEAWFVLPESSPTLRATRVKFAESRGLRLWLPQDDVPCGNPPQIRTVELKGVVVGAMRICGVMTLETPFRLMAVVEYGQPRRTYLATSTAISVQPPWKIPGLLLAVLGVIGGWIVGILTPAIQSAIEKAFVLRRQRVALLTYAARDVHPTLQTIREALLPYTMSSPPEQMSLVTEEVYLNMADPNSLVYRVLPDDERAVYLEPFYALHQELKAFNIAVGQNDQAKAIKAARRALPRLDKLLRVAYVETPEEIAAKNEEVEA
jgi:hypothetical protein